MPRYDDQIPELDAAAFDAEAREYFDAILTGNEEMEFPESPKRRGRLLECIAPTSSETGDYLTAAEVAALLNVPVETVYAAMESRGGVIEGLTFRWVDVRNGCRTGRRWHKRPTVAA